jgi:transitional endoplasmic reticulum ATPase
MILFKYPYRMSFHSSSLSSNKISAVNNQSNLHSHALQLIPKAVYTGHLDIVKAIKRQLRAIFHSMRSIEQGQLLPIELLGEIFVFSVLKIESIGEKPLQQQSVSYQPDQTQIRLTGINDNDDDEVAVKEQEVERLTSSVGAFTLGSFLTDGSSSLSHRLSSMGFAGYDSMMQELLLSLELVLSGDDALSSIGSHGILLYGVSGVGKTLSLQVIAAELGRRKIPFVTLDGVSLQMESEASKLSTSYEFLVQKIETNESFSIGEPNVQGVVLVDNIDAVFLNGNKSGSAEHEDEGDSNGVIPSLASSFMRLIQQFSASKARICIVMTCKQLSSIPEKARRAGCIAKCIEMITPTERMRLEILAFHLALLPLASTSDSSSSASRHHFASRLASLTGGFVAKDLVRICRNALVLACQAAAGDDVDDDDDKAKEVLLIDWHHLLQAQQMIKPSHLTSLNVQSPGSDAFSSPKENDPFAIAGYEDLQRQLLDVITSKFHAIHALALRRMGISSSSGILIYGPSGCGKTRLVKYMASRVQANFVYVKVCYANCHFR